MSTCPECRYCAPESAGPPARRWAHPVRWFDQPCVHCSHRLRAHDPGVPAVLSSADLDEPVAGVAPLR